LVGIHKKELKKDSRYLIYYTFTEEEKKDKDIKMRWDLIMKQWIMISAHHQNRICKLPKRLLPSLSDKKVVYPLNPTIYRTPVYSQMEKILLNQNAKGEITMNVLEGIRKAVIEGIAQQSKRFTEEALNPNNLWKQRKKKKRIL